MNAIKVYILLLLLVCSGVGIHAEQSVPFGFRHIGVSDGLPDNYVKNVLVLPDGRIAVRTSVLLSLYDGQNFVNHPLWKVPGHAIGYRSMMPVLYVDARERVWIKEKGMLEAFDLATEKFLDLKGMLPDVDINDFFVDSGRRIWMTDGKHVFFCDDDLGVVQTIDSSPDIYGTLLGLESDGKRCWMVYDTGIMRCYDMKQKRTVRQEVFLKGKYTGDPRIFIKILENGDLWVFWNNGGGYYVNETRAWNECIGAGGDYLSINAADTDKSGNVWLGTSRHGIYMIDRYSLNISNIEPLYHHASDGTWSNVHSLVVDKESGTVWIGLFNHGMAYFHPVMNNFILYNNENLSGKMDIEDVLSMCETDGNAVLLGTERGVYRFDAVGKRIERIFPELSALLIKMICKDSEGRLWLGSYQDGLYCVENGKMRHRDIVRDTLAVTNIRAMVEDRKGRLWLSVHGGVGRFNPETWTLDLLSDRFPQLAKYMVANTLELDSKGRLVVGADNGMYVYDADKDSLFVPELDRPDSPIVSLGGEKYNCILRDSRNLLWMGTQYGIKIVHEDGAVDYIGEDEGLANLTVHSIQEDNNHEMWVSTLDALYRITLDEVDGKISYKVVCMDLNQGKGLDNLYEFCSLKLHDGTLCFGRLDGFYMFTPENIVLTPTSRAPMFTDFRLFNRQVACGEEYNGRILFAESLNKRRSVTLDYDENFVTVEFSSLNFTNPAQTYFRYQLEGLDKEWIEISSAERQGAATYSYLPPGEYRFRVMAAGNDRVWSPESVFRIEVRPPFWATLWAKVFYFCCFAAFWWLFFLFLRKRNNRKLLRMKEQETERQKEYLYQMKFRFFTNISHELRTPLTLIMAPLGVIRKKLTDEKAIRQLDVVSKNAQELYNLVNQLLDFRKVEMKMEKLNPTFGNLEEFVHSIYSCFQAFAVEKKLDFRLSVSEGSWNVCTDFDKLHKIINNLLSNAFKFTSEGGAVTLVLSEEERGGRPFARISVSDTGIGMTQDEAARIWDRFYQVQNGTKEVGSGIGLHLVKEYVQMLRGEISVESAPGKGSVFTLLLPMDSEAGEMQEAVSSAVSREAEIQPEKTEGEGKKKILLAEDNADFRNFLKDQLEEHYEVLDAPDGEAGEKMAIEHDPDLIISDIMMPKVDGIELCRRIKTNIQTSHIPVVLLTAYTEDGIKMNSYEVGADSYISKPFNYDVLLTRIRKLMEQQKERKQEFRKSINVTPSAIAITTLDEQLIRKALELIERNMDNTEYSVEELSADLGMTRVTLYRKLHGITGQSPKDFIRSIRLKRAAQLLENTDFSISEIADRVGFSTPRYFARLFKDAFGVLPSQYGGRVRGRQEEEEE